MTEKKAVFSDFKLSEEIKELVIARIEAKVNPKFKIFIGSEGSFDKQEMITHVKKGDTIGRHIAQMHINFLKAQADGRLTRALNSVR